LLLLAGLAAALALRHPTPLVLALAPAAALGLARIGPRETGADARPQLLAGALAVLLAAAAIAASLRAGFATDAEALRPLLARLDAPARAAFDPSESRRSRPRTCARCSIARRWRPSPA
jgi:hypothetical protein